MSEAVIRWIGGPLLYARTSDDSHRRRSDLLRQASLKALDEATSLEAPAA